MSGNPLPNALQGWSEAVRVVWEAGARARSIFGGSRPNLGALHYLCKVFVWGAAGGPPCDPTQPAPEAEGLVIV